MAPQVDAGFEALLKPIQDVLTKNWEIRLAKCLEDYLCHLKVGGEDPATNFSEAALVVQNSTHFYCKRVDLVFDFMTKLIDVLQSRDDGDEGENAGGGGQTKKKKSVKALQNEDLQLLDSVFADHNINLKLDKKSKSASDKKTVVLNTSVKVAMKENTNCKVFNSKGLEMGYKNEFRLHWRMHSDGMLREDFYCDIHVKLVHYQGDAVDLNTNCEELHSSLDEMDIARGNEDCDERDFDMSEHPCSPVIPEPSAVDEEGPPLNPVDPVISNPKGNEPKKKPIKDVWEVLSDNIKVNELKLKKRRTFTLPKSLLDGILNNRKRKREDGKSMAAKEVPQYLFHFELGGEKEPISMIDFSLAQEQGKKSEILRRRQFENHMAVMRAAKEFDGVLEGFHSDHEDEDFQGFDNHQEDEDDCNNDDDGGIADSGTLPEIDIGLVNPAETLGVPLDVNYERDETSQIDSYERDAYLTMKQYQKGKTDNTNMVTEIAKRVQAWHESIGPILAAAEARTKFDIHHYGTSILEKFPADLDENGKPPVKPFADITVGQPKKEISRYFLSSLMLANTYNVEIIKGDTRDLAIDCMNLKLLSRVRHHEEMDDNLRATSKDCGH